MLEYQLSNLGTFSILNQESTIWFGTASNSPTTASFQSPQYFAFGTNVFVPGMHVGSSSVTNFIQNGSANFGGSICYNSFNETSTPPSPMTIPRGKNYYLTEVSSNLTVNLPASPELGDLVHYENHNTVSVRFTLTISGNGNSIRSATNSIRTSINDIQGAFHWDGTYWNHLYTP